MNVTRLHPGDAGYPSVLQMYLGDRAPTTLTAWGDLDLMKGKRLALFCSVRCPGNLILQTYDLAQRLRQTEVTVIGGFHSPMERECLAILLRGIRPIIVCPARSIEGMRVRVEYKRPLADGRLLLLSPLAKTQRRITAEAAIARNRFVGALADVIFVAYAEPSSKTEEFCRDVLTWRKPLYTLESEANRSLITLGAKPLCPHEAHKLWGTPGSG